MKIDTISEKGKGLSRKIEIATEKGKIICRYSISIIPNVGRESIYHKHKEGIRFLRYIEPPNTAPHSVKEFPIEYYHL